MNPLQCCKDRCAGGGDKDYCIINSISPTFWIVKRREQFHETIPLIIEYKTSLPFLEMSDLIMNASFLMENMHDLTYSIPKLKFESRSEFVIC
jgi:hypothetical protein